MTFSSGLDCHRSGIMRVPRRFRWPECRGYIRLQGPLREGGAFFGYSGVPLVVNSLLISLLFSFFESFEGVESLKTFVLFSSILCALFSIVLGFIDISNLFSIQADNSLPME